MTNKLTGPVAALALALAATGCAALFGEADGAPGATADEAHVQVVNNNWQEVVVYAVRTGTRSRLGNVTSMSTRTFRIPGHILAGSGAVELMANPIGSTRPHRTDRILLRDGDRIHWTLENVLAQSSYTVSGGSR